MSKPLDDHRHKLIAKILSAGSHEEVKRYCNAAVDDLEGQQLNGHLIVSFLEKTVNELANFNPVHQNSQQWNNIISAKVLCNRLIQQYSFS